MSDYPPEVQNLLDTAIAWRDSSGTSLGLTELDTRGPLRDAVDAYRKATAPPEPFERYVYRWSNGQWDDDLYTDDPQDDVIDRLVSLWRCTVTPIERVRP